MIIGERNNGMIDRLSISGVTTGIIILSKFLASFILALLQFTFIIVFTSIVFNNYWEFLF